MSRQVEPGGLTTLLARPAVRIVLAALDTPGEETRLVGGCVRDALLGSSAADIDLATTLRPEAVIERARAAGLKAVPTGIEHGTITVITGHEPVEVTTLREDVETDGRHAVVRFGGDFAQDALRILRFFRFHARFGDGSPVSDALDACIGARNALDELSRERVRAEFLKLLMVPGAVPVVTCLSQTGLLQRISGGVAELGRLARSVAAEQDAPMRLAALCVHAAPDEVRLRDRLRLSNAEAGSLAGYAAALAALHGRASLSAREIRALAALHGGRMVADTLAILAGEPRPRVEPEAKAEAARLASGENDPVFPLSGADLVAAGLRPGRTIGTGLAAAKAEWLAQGCPDDAVSRADLLDLAVKAAR